VTTAVFLSARDKATRLPGKTYADIGGQPAIELLITRVLRATEPDMVVLCTSAHAHDRRLLETASALGIPSFAGSEDDKLDRYLRAAERFGVDFAAVVDGDDIFCEPMYIDRIVRERDARGGDYVVVEGLPLGATAFGVSTDAIRRVCAEKDEADTEVWGGYFARDGFDARRLEPDPSDRRPDLRMTLDYPEDLEFFRRVQLAFGSPSGGPPLGDIIAYCDRHPEVATINAAVQQRYEANLLRSAPARFRAT
jgi:spore coat polysaccharide biosynthesis protein SpsF